MKVEVNDLRLRENEVHVGMVVALCLEGKQEPETDKHGALLLRVLVGGVPSRVKLYPVRGGIERHGHSVLAHPLEGFRENVRFMPIQVFSPSTAPANTDFVVFVDGQRLKNEQGRYIYIATNDKRRIAAHPGRPYEHGEEIELPPNAVLVPITEIGRAPRERRSLKAVLCFS